MNKSKPMTNRLRIIFMMIADVCAVSVSMFSALVVREGFNIRLILNDYSKSYLCGILITILLLPAFFYAVKQYKTLWKFAGFTEVFKFSVANAFTFLFFTAFNMFICNKIGFKNFPIGTYTIGFVFSQVIMLGYRVFLRKRYSSDFPIKHTEKKIRTMIIGGGEAAALLLRELRYNNSLDYEPVCVIDDDKTKLGRSLFSVDIVGDMSVLDEKIKKYDVHTIIFAIPSMPAKKKAALLERCAKTGCVVKTMPCIGNLLDQKKSIPTIRDIEIKDLLGREQITTDLAQIKGYLDGKTVLITGGGGSIGSELCRQIASSNPKKLVIFDIYENNAYEILNELKRNFPLLDVIALIGSVRDPERLDEIFDKYRPDIVYHAAAHKHVPLMEDSPNESIKNNVFGTFNTIRAADKYAVKRFVLISTDKAVNPTNIMGATKRICEMLIQTADKRSNTEFVAVRFGNVLGSNGSVVPLFKEQIKAGGPVTVTHPDIIRYFMTIPEAVSLVLQAGAYAKGGEIFVLDMGAPVKILSMAENLIRLSGLIPYKDIKIEFSGLRPGEKLYEELLLAEEGLTETQNNLIHICRPIEIDDKHLNDCLEELRDSMRREDCADIRALVAKIVTTYKIPENI